MILTISVVCLYAAVSKVSPIATYIGVALLAIQMISYSLVFLVNPGMPAPEEIAKDKLDRIRNNKALYCKICGISKKDKKKVVHCEDCDV